MTSVPFVLSEVLAECGEISHGFFTRRGGVSGGDFDSLNCSYSSGDSFDNVSENRARISSSLDCKTLTSLKQIHSNTVHVVDRKWDARQVVEGDGMITDDPGVAIGVLGADCASVLFCDSERGIVAAAHAGWKGAVLGVTDSVIEKMVSMGCDPSSIRVAVGPTIQQSSYEVGLKFVDQFAALSTIEHLDCFDFRGDTAYFDLPGYILKKLRHAGIMMVEVLPLDTYTEESDFFSYRRMCHRGEQHYGRQIGVIVLK